MTDSPELIALRASLAGSAPVSPEVLALRAELAVMRKQLNASSSDIVQRHCNACGLDLPEGNCPQHPTEKVNSIVIDQQTKRPTILK